MTCTFNCKIFGFSAKNRVACAMNDGLVAELVLPSNGSISIEMMETMRSAHILSPEPMNLLEPIIWSPEAKVLTCGGIEFPSHSTSFSDNGNYNESDPMSI